MRVRVCVRFLRGNQFGFFCAVSFRKAPYCGIVCVCLVTCGMEGGEVNEERRCVTLFHVMFAVVSFLTYFLIW